ncbi:neural cell adhesion molecule 1 isoform X2 [Polypterus senegalus]|uniref:neural cell adhesion molecule 1 isoform X2 n=1 Tax=Polypterus senegalus TaxID=55291 RepID=UPI0019636C41|nr:neural cell adhesion molecule 1 isoform X2 [Polypterus senegalus]
MLRILIWISILVINSDAAKKMIIIPPPSTEIYTDTTIYCRVSGGEAEFQWFKPNGEEISDNDDDLRVETVDEETSKLIIANIQLKHNGVYKCKSIFEDNQEKVSSISISVTKKISISNTDTYKEFLEGSNAVLSCNATGIPAPDIIWLHDRLDVTKKNDDRIKVIDNRYLHINGIRKTDSGTYTCKAQIKQRNEELSRDFSVVVNVPPTAQIQKEKNIIAGPNKNLTLICLVNGNPKPTITWKRNEKPLMMDTSKYSFNSDKSELNIRGIEKSDEGNYTCVAVNTLGEASDKTWLNISVMPKVMLNETAVVIPGQNINISCKATGDPLPTIIFSRNGKTLKSDEKKNADGTTIASFPIKNMNPSDGGAYTCSATSPAGRDSKTIQVITIPSTPVNVMVIPGPASLKINFSGLLDGGAPIISYTLQWRHKGRNDWDSTTVKAAEPLRISGLKSYEKYEVRVSASNTAGQSKFSEIMTAQTKALREPDKPVFSSEGTVEGNSYNISFQQLEDGGVPIQHYIVRYHAVSGNEDVKELRLDPEAKFVILEDLEWNTEYEVEIRAVNNRGESKPSIYNFNMPQELKAVSQKKGLGIGGIVAIVMVILLVLLIAVDTACYYTNHCGMMMCIAVNVFGKRPPGAKQHDFEGSSRFTNEVKLQGLNLPRGSVSKQLNGAQCEMTCDKAPLTQFEKLPHKGENGSSSFTEA